MTSNTKDPLLRSPRAKLARWVARIVLVTVLSVGIVVGLWYMFSPQDVLVSVSPDGAHRILIRQPRFVFIDRNFHVVLIDERTNTERDILESWDQSPTIDTERFVWSSDSRAVALIGDRYYVVPGSELPNGLIVFLVYDVDDESLYCNSEYDRGIPRISAQRAIEMIGDQILADNPP